MNKDFVFELDGAEEKKVVQSPWEFSGYSADVRKEYAERNTTSIDQKIREIRSSKNDYKGGPRGESEDEDEDEDEGEEGEEDSDISEVEDVDMEGGEDDDDEEEEEEDDDDDDSDEEEEIDEEEDANGVDPEVSGESADEEEGEDDEDEEEEDVDEEMEELPKGKKSSRSKLPKVHVENVHGTEEGGQAGSFFSSSAGASFSATSFGELNLSRPLIRACEALGYKQPTPIQAACIPLALTGRDICGSAVTGSGKTGAFALPMLERLLYRPRRIPAIRCLILTPTRELAVQVHSMIQKLAQFTDITSAIVVGGLSSKVQQVALRGRPDIVVATPGRMLDHLQNSLSVGLEDLSILVLDEADRLLELGFTQEVHELVRQCPKRRQTMLFSATMTDQVSNLINLSLNSPVRLSADPSTKRPISLSEEVVKIRPAFEGDKEAVLLALCTRTFKEKVIIFSGMKVEAHRLKILFGLSGLKAAELHGNLTQAMRLDALESFRKQEVDFLIATDVAARGLDIVGVETVINFHCPSDITIYVHRVGRTARAGRKGCAVTFVTERERSLLKAIAKKAGSQLQNRQIPPASIYKWRSKIEEMEDGVREVMQAEREEKALRKAEMEVNKAQNMMEHEKEIYSRPKREWFLTTKEKRTTAAAAKAGKAGVGEPSAVAVTSVEEADEAKRKEKRKREREKNMTRKQRRKLEAEREDAEDADEGPDSEADEEVGKKRGKKGKSSEGSKEGKTSIVDLAYRRAKAAKSVDRLVKAGKIGPQKKLKGSKTSDQKTKSRKAEAEELFEGDFGEDKRKKGKKEFQPKKPARKPGVSKRAFKSKARYKRRK
ncbi:hypothetical protein KC19_7G151100 [Ceratodon purpureus]|uniref:DEAD-box ATP-dependent RNA helicase 28 n=1 Tax=Ceratodon purpureus TaxID=3225 RepID=A0A8T0H9X0_CERPU|nr:hypothetical protein KC19_7G151100 [Ceratodon purpureus]